MSVFIIISFFWLEEKEVPSESLTLNLSNVWLPTWSVYAAAPAATDLPIPWVEKFFWSSVFINFFSCVILAKYLFSLGIKPVSLPITW